MNRAGTSTWRPPVRTSGSSLRSITPRWSASTRRSPTRQMAGLNFVHAVAQAWEAGKLFHIDLNDQNPGRYDQDFRFGSANLKAAFWLVKFLEDVGYDGPRHFDAHAYRTEDYDGVRDFARGCMRTYLILKERAARWNADPEIQAILQVATSTNGLPSSTAYSHEHRTALLAYIVRSADAPRNRPRLRAARPVDDRSMLGIR